MLRLMACYSTCHQVIQVIPLVRTLNTLRNDHFYIIVLISSKIIQFNASSDIYFFSWILQDMITSCSWFVMLSNSMPRDILWLGYRISLVFYWNVFSSSHGLKIGSVDGYSILVLALRRVPSSFRRGYVASIMGSWSLMDFSRLLGVTMN